MAAAPESIAELAPSGTLRAAINVANPATARVEQDGSLSGPSVDLARALAEAAGLPLTTVRYGSAGAVTAAGEAGDAWDIAFLAIDPLRAQYLHFSSPYLSIEAGLAVPADSSIRMIEEVDRTGNRIATSAGAAYDLHLERVLTAAERVPFANPEASFAAFRSGGFAAVAGVRVALERAFPDPAETRILAGRLLAIDHAVAVPVDRRRAAAFVEDVLTNLRS